MPRIRTFKPEIWSHPVMGRQDDKVKTMALALLNWADDEGYFYADPSAIRSFARPFDDESTTTLVCLQQLMKIEYISIRLHELRGYIGHITSFLEHQRIDRPKSSVIKRFYEESTPTINLRRIDDESTIDRAGKERNVKEIKEKIPAAPSARGAKEGKPDSTQVAKAQCDNRHNRSEQIVKGWYQDWAGVECPWDGGEARQLSSLLKAWPGATDAQFMTCLENLAKSECIAAGTRPRIWLSDLPRFIKGPLDQYWKPKGVSNGNGNSKTEQRNASNREAIIQGIRGARVSRNAVHDGPAVPHGDHAGNKRVVDIDADRARPFVRPADS